MIKTNCVWMVVIFVLVTEWCHCSYGCLKQEKIALLQVKDWINHPNGHSLPDWVDNKEHGDCCKWTGVKCNAATRRVDELVLEYKRDRSLGDLHLNASLFQPFEDLQNLNLAENMLVGCIDDQGSEFRSSRMRNLEALDLSLNGFNNSIFSCLSGLSSLKSLNLASNRLTGSDHINELYNLTNLEELFLDASHLPMNFLQGLGAISALKVLSLTGSKLNGTLPSEGWSELESLEELYLFKNEFEGQLPASLRNLTSLRILDLSDNSFVGDIASSPLTDLKMLQYLSISENQFQVPLSFNSFMNHSKLKFISCDSNNLIEEPSFPNFAPTFQLKFLSIRNCDSEPYAELPNFLHNQCDLRVIDLSNSNFSGAFPSWLLENNTRLTELHLKDNSFTGSLQFPRYSNPNLSILDISNNRHMHGELPRVTCSIFPQLKFLIMANNGLTGSIPPCLGNMSSLQGLDLSNNQLSGRMLNQFTSKSFLLLSNNNLDGQISPSVFNSSVCQSLYLDGNNFWGKISDVSSIGSFPNYLDISGNHFSGNLPRWIGNLSALLVMDFSRNHFEGSIPTEFCKLDFLEYFDLSENNLSGSIPSCFRPPGLVHIHLYKNRLTGPLTEAFYNSTSLVTLDLAHNNFTGPIPNWIDRLSTLGILILRSNNFNGDLPAQLCSIERLSILDLSQNKFSGFLPSCLSNLTFGSQVRKAFFSSHSWGYSSTRNAYLWQIGRPMLALRTFEVRQLHDYATVNVDNSIKFATKRESYTYKGNILVFMSGIDLSCNGFIGQVPPEFGNIGGIRALNLSHNNLTGLIPSTFSTFKQIESLDLSYNNFNGEIPYQLTELNFLAVFSVAYNNLSGKTPDRIGQFISFDETSYEGNPLLCGPPLPKNCSIVEPPLLPNDARENGFIDMDVFCASFVVSYIVVVLTIAVILWTNRHWRRAWFYLIEVCICSCYHFGLHVFAKLSRFR